MGLKQKVAGLDCYRCTYLKLETSNAALGYVLKAFSKLSSDHCKLEKDEDLHEVNKRTCPPAEDGQVSKCVVLNGTVTTSLDLTVTSVEFKYHTLTRDCVQVAENDATTTDGCHDALPSSGPVRRLMKGSLQSLSVGDVSYRGTACYYGHLTAAAGRVYHAPAVIVTLLVSFLLSAVA
ncbi:hypothetical protein NP493_165g04037 [Ridgeia piscesae]|uniref:Uncharacterized protein n=1 Tax=Ridgeia piscesae TaxID=27915 RepID=A0AAD9UFK5_RIDPI|nr:hypothetical protein NP493_165g04037 [Ridgeia piscesae]